MSRYCYVNTMEVCSSVSFLIFILAYSGDAVYLYSTTDDPDSTPPSPAQLPSQNNENVSEPIAQSEGAEPSDIEEDDQSADDPDEEMADEAHESVPVVLPRSRFAGACNVRTVKDGERVSCFLLYVEA